MQAPVPYEADDQKALVELIEQVLDPRWIFFHVPNGERRHISTAVKLKDMGTQRGVSDLIFIGPRHINGGGVFLELKRRGHKGRMSDDQIKFRDHVLRCGFNYICTNDLQLALDDLFDLGVLRNRVRVSA